MLRVPIQCRRLPLACRTTGRSPVASITSNLIKRRISSTPNPVPELDVPLVYPTPGPNREIVVKETLASLQTNKELYQWKHDNYPPHVAEVPPQDAKSSTQIFNVQALLQTGGMLQQELATRYFRLAPDPEAPTSFDALVEHNQSLRGPPGDRKDRDWYSDAVFAQQHFTGTNATTITLAKEWKGRFIKSAEGLQKKEMADFISSLADDCLYVQDYSYFRSAMGLKDPAVELTSGDGRYGCAPVALFHLGENGQLHPLAIVIDYKGSMDASVVIFNKSLKPSNDLDAQKEDWAWRYAKTCVQSADWLRHEVAIHLVNTHLVEEATIVAAHRTLPPAHILYHLLQKHWDTTLSLNQEARSRLVPEVIQKIAGVGGGELFKFLNHAYSTFDWARLRIPNDLEARGFPLAELEKNSPKFHNYAYARNMALMWPAIRTFVEGVLRPYYGGDKQVENDQFVQQFCDEMRSEQGANMSTFPEIKTLDELIDTVTMCIHIASPQHTAVNYLQHYYQVFVPNKPWAMYTPLPGSLSELQRYGEKQLMDALPFKKTKDWLIGAQLPYLLSFEVIGTSGLLSYAKAQSLSPIRVIAESAQVFETKLEELAVTFKKHSKELDDNKNTRYMVMDPAMTAVSILI